MPSQGAIAGVPRRTLNLTLGAVLLAAGMSVTADVSFELWQSADRLKALHEELWTALADQARASHRHGDEAATAQIAAAVTDLMAVDTESATPAIQRTLQSFVIPPARIETLHTLDAPGDQQTPSVRAAFRIRGLAPDAVVALVRHFERAAPAIVFDEMRVSIRTRPGAMAPNGSGPSPDVREAELTGIVSVFVAQGASSPPRGGTRP